MFDQLSVLDAERVERKYLIELAGLGGRILSIVLVNDAACTSDRQARADRRRDGKTPSRLFYSLRAARAWPCSRAFDWLAAQRPAWRRAEERGRRQNGSWGPLSWSLGP